jgi:hypothetical protein
MNPSAQRIIDIARSVATETIPNPPFQPRPSAQLWPWHIPSCVAVVG